MYRKWVNLDPRHDCHNLIILSWFIPLGLLWFAQTALPPKHWILGILAGVPFGLGLVALFLGRKSYLTDCYGRFAASALAANAVLRSFFGAGFPLFSKKMYDKLETAWATKLTRVLGTRAGTAPAGILQVRTTIKSVKQISYQNDSNTRETQHLSNSFENLGSDREQHFDIFFSLYNRMDVVSSFDLTFLYSGDLIIRHELYFQWRWPNNVISDLLTNGLGYTRITSPAAIFHFITITFLNHFEQPCTISLLAL